MGEKKNIILNLVEQGKRAGKVTTKEINDTLEEMGFEVELVDKLYETLEANNIEIVEEPDADAEEFTLTEDTVDVLESALTAEGVSIDDPVSYTHLYVYKRQIWLSWPLGWVVATLMSLAFYKKGVWKQMLKS